MIPHLNHLLPWDSLLKLSCFYHNKTSIKMKTGKCGKIHIVNKDDKLKVKYRKYITEDMICNKKECKTYQDFFIEIKKPNSKDEWRMIDYPKFLEIKIDKVDENNYFGSSFFKEDCCHKPEFLKNDYEIILNFFRNFNKSINDFSEDYLQKLLSCKRRNYKKLFFLPADYDESEYIKNYLSINEKEYNSIKNEDIEIIKLLGACCSDNKNDMLSLFNIIIQDKEFLSRCYKLIDTYSLNSFIFTMIYFTLLPLYFNLNIFIAKGKFDTENIIDENLYKSVSLDMFTEGYSFRSDIYTIRSHLFPPFMTKMIFKKFNSKYDYIKTGNIKVEQIPNILKKIFKFLYNLLTVFKFHNLYHKTNWIPDFWTYIEKYLDVPEDLLTEEMKKEIDGYFYKKYFKY